MRFKIRNINFFVMIIFCLTAMLKACGKAEEYVKANAKQYFKECYNFELPESSTVIQYTNENVNSFKAKIEINEQDLEYINNGLINSFALVCVQENEAISENYVGHTYTEDDVTSIKNLNNWLDINHNNIQTCYFKHTAGVKQPDGSYPKSVPNWVFVCKNEDGKYYIYVVKT